MVEAYDWCEENYAVHPYIAEFWNVITSLFIAGLGTSVVLKNMDNGGKYLGLAQVLIGVTSAWYHSTLTHAGQFADEASIAIYTCAVFHQIYKDDVNKLNLFNIATVLCIAISILYPHISQVILAAHCTSTVVAIFWKMPIMNVAKEHLRRFIVLFVAAAICWVHERFAPCDGHTWICHPLWHVFSGLSIVSMTNYVVLLMTYTEAQKKKDHELRQTLRQSTFQRRTV